MIEINFGLSASVRHKTNIYESAGPFVLDEMCADKILESYGLPKGKFTLDEVKQMSSERLRQNSQSSR